MIVRPANLYDLGALWGLWVELQAEEGLTWSDPSERYPVPDAVSGAGQDIFAKQRAGLLINSDVSFLVAEEGGTVVGYMLASIGSYPVGWPSVALRIHEMYVQPEHRKGGRKGAAWLLREELKAWAKEKGAQAIEVDCIATDRQLERWESKGFVQYHVKLWKVMEE